MAESGFCVRLLRIFRRRSPVLSPFFFSFRATLPRAFHLRVRFVPKTWGIKSEDATYCDP